MRAALRGINAAVVGPLLAALFDPAWTSTVRSLTNFGPALAAVLLFALWKLPPWLVVAFAAVGGQILAAA